MRALFQGRLSSMSYKDSVPGKTVSGSPPALLIRGTLCWPALSAPVKIHHVDLQPEYSNPFQFHTDLSPI